MTGIILFLSGAFVGVVLTCILVSGRSDYTEERQWTILTDDEESYPGVFEYVLVEDDMGDLNIAFCYPDYEWYISNGENSMKLIGNVVKWKRIS